jgi:hypothetical protein
MEKICPYQVLYNTETNPSGSTGDEPGRHADLIQVSV